MGSSGSHVACSIPCLYRRTFTNDTCLFMSSLTSRVKVLIGSSLCDISFWNSISFGEITCVESDRYLLNIDTWNILWIFSSSLGNANLYATEPIFLVILYGLINLGLLLSIRIVKSFSNTKLSKILSCRLGIQYLFFLNQRMTFDDSMRPLDNP